MEILKYDFDYLIVGQGLAGTALAVHLMDLGKTVLVANDSLLPSSSRVAAGIFNPLTGKKLVKTWLADDLFPYAQQFYAKMENRLGATLIHEAPIYRPFRSVEEQNTYLAQTADQSIAPYVTNSATDPGISEYINGAYGGLQVIRSGWIDLPLFLEINEEYIAWKGMRFGKAVFCQGFEATKNELFGWLPFAPVKGQILEIATNRVLRPYIINQGIFILPLSESLCRVGATYSWNDLDWIATEEARSELETKFGQLFKGEYRVTGQVAGIRPSSNDRRPILGTHPRYSNVLILNGLGTKGVTLAPYFSNQLAEYLEGGKELNPLVNIKRYFSLYFR
jgi:glycine/D-amino acid oxidase-like deaminating enzyme